MSKGIIEIGDIFGTWEVIGKEVDSKKYNYNYICRCSCGHKRSIRKDKLIGYKYPKCTECTSNLMIQMKADLIKSMWNTSLNGKLPVLSQLDVSRQYHWTCPNGHNFKENIFFLDTKCRCCDIMESKIKLKQEMNINYNKLVDYIDEVTSDSFDDVHILIYEKDMLIKVEIKNVLILCVPKIHRIFDKDIHGSKEEYFKMKNRISELVNSVKEDAREHIIMDMELIPKKDFKTMFKILSHVKNI